MLDGPTVRLFYTILTQYQAHHIYLFCYICPRRDHYLQMEESFEWLLKFERLEHFIPYRAPTGPYWHCQNH